MPSTEFGVNSDQAVKVWSHTTMQEAMEKSFFNRFMGSGKNAVIQRLTELEKAAGDTIKFDLLSSMRNDGVQGDAQLEDYEEPLTYAQDSLEIDQLRNATAWMTMSQQRTLHKLREDGKEILSTWWAWKFDTMMFAMLAGLAGNGPESASGTLGGTGSGAPGFANNPTVAPDAAHVVTTGAAFDLQDIDLLISKAKTINPRLRPSMVDGQKKFCFVMHPWTVWQLKTNTNEGQWNLMHQQIAENGSKNPIYTGALAEYNGVILYESEHVPIDIANQLVHNLFLGAQAGVIAFGGAHGKGRGASYGKGRWFNWHEQTRDYGNRMGIAGSSIFGIKKTRFNSADYGVLRLTTTDPEPT